MTRRALAAALAAAALSIGVAPVAAQTADVGLIADREPVDEAFLQFVAVPVEHRFEAEEDARAEPSVAFVVDLRGADGLVRVWRRSDRATLERRLEEPDPEGYALAVMGSELLEVARTGSTAEVVEVDPPASEGASDAEAVPEEVTPGPAEGDGSPEETEDEGPNADPGAPEERPERVAFTVGAAFEGWFSPGPDGPWQLQPALAFELAYVPAGEDWQVAVGLFGAGLGQYGQRVGDIEGRYQRYDGGLRLTFGGAFGPVGTRLLGHVRAGASAVVGRAEDESAGNAGEGTATLAAGFVGPSIEVRQPIVAGLEITLELGADALIEPIELTARGATFARESSVRLSGRLGIAYRVE